MKSFEELTEQWNDGPRPPRDQGEVKVICLRKGDGVHESVETGELSVEAGLVGDRWSSGEQPERHSQLTLISARVSELIAHPALAGYESGDNFVVDLDLSEENLSPGTRLRLGEALVEITPEPHTGCAKFAARFGPPALKFVNYKPTRPQRLRGVHAEVIEPGSVRVGDVVRVLR